MKTPKEKAIVIYIKMLKWQDDVDKYYDFNIINTTAKQCALIAVDEILKAVERDWSFMEVRQKYWQEVKQEINNL